LLLQRLLLLLLLLWLHHLAWPLLLHAWLAVLLLLLRGCLWCVTRLLLLCWRHHAVALLAAVACWIRCWLCSSAACWRERRTGLRL
jgi:hypothetical protein